MKMHKFYTVTDIKNAHRGPWFSPSTLRFFRSRVSDKLYKGPDGLFFVTSEKPPLGDRAYSVRQYHQDDDRISTVGEFCGYLNRRLAHHAALRLANPRQEE